MQWIFSIAILLMFGAIEPAPPVDANSTEYLTDTYKMEILKKVNRVRTTGCFCGRRYMPATTPLKWNDTLYKSALGHAKEMTRYNFFAHYSIDGDDIGERLEDYGYDWQVAGENLGEGQKSFEEVLRDWLDSRSHCKMPAIKPNAAPTAISFHSS